MTGGTRGGISRGTANGHLGFHKQKEAGYSSISDKVTRGIYDHQTYAACSAVYPPYHREVGSSFQI